MPGDTFITSPGQNKGSQQSSKTQSRLDKINLDYGETSDSLKGYTEKDKIAIEALLEKKRLAAEKLAKLTTADKVVSPDGKKENKGSEDYKAERIATSDKLAKYRADNVENKNKDDAAIENRSMVDGVIKGLGSIAAGALGNAQKLSVGDKYKYDSYDPTNDSRAAEFRATQNDKVLMDKYGTPIEESKEQQKAEIAAVEAEIKAIQDTVAARTKASTTETTASKDGNRDASGNRTDGSSQGASWASPSDGGGAGGGGATEMFTSEDTKKFHDTSTFAFSNATKDPTATSQVKRDQYISELDKPVNNPVAASIAREYVKTHPNATIDEIFEFTRHPLASRFNGNGDLNARMYQAIGGKELRNKKTGEVLEIKPAQPANNGTPTPQPAKDGAVVPPTQTKETEQRSPKQKPAEKLGTGMTKFKLGLQPGEKIVIINDEPIAVSEKDGGFNLRNSDGVPKLISPAAYKKLTTRS